MLPSNSLTGQNATFAVATRLLLRNFVERYAASFCVYTCYRPCAVFVTPGGGKMLRYNAVRAIVIVSMVMVVVWGFFEFYPPRETFGPRTFNRCAFWQTVTPTLTATERALTGCYPSIATPVR